VEFHSKSNWTRPVAFGLGWLPVAIGKKFANTLSDFAPGRCLMGEMHEESDAQLLRDYAEDGDEAAFRELVTRHTALVYSAAFRQVYSPDLAGDIAQSVFTDLARKARLLAEKLPAGGSLAGWLHCGARYAALSQLRDTRCRLANERQAMEQLLTSSESAPDWERIGPVLDEALDSLGDEDREALLLRYFRNHDFRAVGLALGVSDDAAQKRVSRAVESLREFFVKRGVTVGAGGLVALITANAVQAAPAGLAVTISTAALLAGTTLATTATATTIKTIAMTALQKTLITATIAAAVGTGIYEVRQAASLRSEVQALQQQQAPLAEEIQKLHRERDNATNRLAELNDAFAKNKKDNSELLRLRGEAARLRRESQELAQLALKTGTKDEGDSANQSWLDRARRLKQRLDQTPSEKNPETQFLTEDDWLWAAKRKLDTDDDYRAAFADLRARGEDNFLRTAESALRNYLATNSNTFPTDLAQLKPFFNSQPPDEILQRYQIVPADSLPQANISGQSGGWLITLKSSDSGSFPMLGTNGFGGTHYDEANSMGILAPAMKALMDATPTINGRKSIDLQQVEPYLMTPEQKAAYQRLMKSHKPVSQ
jgi:RNA polymerase sigma factor (sigma-70 family)